MIAGHSRIDSMPAVTYVMPTRDRLEVLKETLERLGALPHHRASLILVDNNSRTRFQAPRALANGIGVEVLSLSENLGAAGRNRGVHAADRSCEWVIMLDDDSHPVDLGFLDALADASNDTAAVAAEIHLPRCGTRESGGLPEVFIGCGVALRRRLFLDAGGYDPAFHYYAEEYDLAAKLLLMGYRVTLDRRFQVHHNKSPVGRDMNIIMQRLVRNNAWVSMRYSPPKRRRADVQECITRYGRIAWKENALRGYCRGLGNLSTTLLAQRRRPMSQLVHDRFTGLAVARESLHRAFQSRAFRSACVLDEGKNAWAVRQALSEVGVKVVLDERNADVVVPATLSPGPLLDAWERLTETEATRNRRRVVAPWLHLVSAQDACSTRKPSEFIALSTAPETCSARTLTTP